MVDAVEKVNHLLHARLCGFGPRVDPVVAGLELLRKGRALRGGPAGGAERLEGVLQVIRS